MALVTIGTLTVERRDVERVLLHHDRRRPYSRPSVALVMRNGTRHELDGASVTREQLARLVQGV